MKRIALLLVGVFLLTAPAGVALAADAESEGSQKLTGEYHWTKRDKRGALEAIFTPDGENKWAVAFHFNFRDKPHIYEGVAKGSLSDGALSGEVKNEDKKRTFTFTGSFQGGTFSGSHAEIREDGTRETGTLTLSR